MHAVRKQEDEIKKWKMKTKTKKTKIQEKGTRDKNKEDVGGCWGDLTFKMGWKIAMEAA